jgi:hypothetical protein
VLEVMVVAVKPAGALQLAGAVVVNCAPMYITTSGSTSSTLLSNHIDALAVRPLTVTDVSEVAVAALVQVAAVDNL